MILKKWNVVSWNDRFITTDDRLLKYQSEDIQIVTLGEIIYLVEKLGIVDAERFNAMVKRESIDYTAWRKTYFDKMDLDPVSAGAEAYAQNHPYKGKGIRV